MWLDADGPLTTLCILPKSLPILKIFLLEDLALQSDLAIDSLEYALEVKTVQRGCMQSLCLSKEHLGKKTV